MYRMEQYLRELYYNPATGYTGIAELWRRIKADKQKIKYKDLKQWLRQQETYTLHKPALKKFPTRKVIVDAIDEQWQADIVDMQAFARDNDGYRYLLTIIDVLSKFSWAIPIKTKRGVEVTKAFETVFTDRIPNIIQFDEGKEFYNQDVKVLLEQNNIKWFSTQSDKKASIVERFNRTLKTRMWKYFTAKGTRKWIDIIDTLIKSYNETYHRSIEMTPTAASRPENEGAVWYNLYGAYLVDTYGKAKFNIGQTVRISKYKGVFGKGYLPNYTTELFKVSKVLYGNPIVYKLEDLAEEPIEGIFYEEELSEYDDVSKLYKVERILRKTIVNGKKYALIKWQGYDAKFNSWEPMENIS